MTINSILTILLGGVFHAAVLFLVAAGLQLVFGVQNILNLACGAFYALGAYFGITAVSVAAAFGLPTPLFLPVLILSGIVIGLIGVPLERLLRPLYRRDVTYPLLMTFAFVLMFHDVFLHFWGSRPRTLSIIYYLAYGSIEPLGVRVPVYNLIVILASVLIASGLGLFLQRTKTGRIIRATAENRDMTEGLGVNVGRIFTIVFTVGCMLGTVGGALVVPSSVAALPMAINLVIEAFAVVVIGGLGSMRGALVGALVVGLVQAVVTVVMPEVTMLSIYLIVIATLLLKPAGLFGRAAI